jgi:hypothetical protein
LRIDRALAVAGLLQPILAAALMAGSPVVLCASPAWPHPVVMTP